MNKLKELPGVPRYSKAWLVEGRAIRYQLEDTEAATMDAWAGDIAGEMLGWPADRPWLILLDLSSAGIVPSAYALRRARQITTLRPELSGRTAAIVTSKVMAHMASLVLTGLPNSQRRQRQVFVTEAAAVAWLLQDALAASTAARTSSTHKD